MEHLNPNQIHFTSHDKNITNKNYRIYNNIKSEFCNSDFFMLLSYPAQAMVIIDGLQTAFNDDPV